MNYRLQHNVRGSIGAWKATLEAFHLSKQKRTIYLLQNRTFLFVANSVFFHLVGSTVAVISNLDGCNCIRFNRKIDGCPEIALLSMPSDWLCEW